MKYFAVADIHGFYTPLLTALEKAGYFAEKEKKLVVCGDLFDRGGEAENLQSFLCDLLEKDEVILIRGNHEDLCEELVSHAERWFREGIVSSHHFRNGTVDTVLQLTGMSLYEATLFPTRLRDLMRETPYFRTLLPAMRDYFETEHYLFTHGYLPCYSYGERKYRRYLLREDWKNSTLEEWREARWFNGMAAAACGARAEKTVICGHFHTSYGHAVLEGKGSEFGEDADFTPYRGEGVWAIDGCTAFSNMVNCIVVEE